MTLWDFLTSDALAQKDKASDYDVYITSNVDFKAFRVKDCECPCLLTRVYNFYKKRNL